MIIFVAGSITLLLYLRVRQKVQKTIETERIRIREVENLRKEIARDFHDEMGNQLTRIINYVSLMKLNGNGNHSIANGGKGYQADLYKKVEESSKYLYSGTRDFIWAIDPVNDELTKLFIHIRDFGERLFEEKSIQFRAYDEVKEYIKLPNGFSREANLIFKEAMTNAFKYSDASNVRFSLQRVNGHLQLSFEDDGNGFDSEDNDKSNGLRNIKARAERIGAYLNIKTKSREGTAVTLKFNLTKNKNYGHAI
jgi:signal transduction histidine kinase